MTRRTAKKSQFAGQDFLGCTRYPACRGVRGAHTHHRLLLREITTVDQHSADLSCGIADACDAQVYSVARGRPQNLAFTRRFRGRGNPRTTPRIQPGKNSRHRPFVDTSAPRVISENGRKLRTTKIRLSALTQEQLERRIATSQRHMGAIAIMLSPDDPPELARWLTELQRPDLTTNEREEVIWALYDYFEPETDNDWIGNHKTSMG